MQLFSLLAMPGVMILPTGYQIGLDWLGHFARIIIEGVGITGLGIIVFNLVLKAITLPFDIYQRVSSRKQNLIMKQMQPELEKLQKQYANDKQMYNQKMFELQKKNGYSMLSACLPMIVSLVILIVAWQGFRAYSQYANLSYFVRMSESYNAAVLVNGVDGTDFKYRSDENGEVFYCLNEDGTERTYPAAWQDGGVFDAGEEGIVYTMSDLKEGKFLVVKSADPQKYIFYQYNVTTEEISREYKLDLDRFADAVKALPEEERAGAEAAIEAAASYVPGVEASEAAFGIVANDYLESLGAAAAAEEFRKDDPGFLWIKNVWYPDVSYDHPIPNYEDFSSEFRTVQVEAADGQKKNLVSLLNSDMYETLTSGLTEEKEAANGYFILIVLSIGFMLLSQIVAMKSNKTANKYQTVDGQGAATQKVMLVVMPLIYAFFSFSYSAAFSIYMTMSSVVAIVVTLLCNLILDRIFKKKEEKAFVEEHTRKLPWMK